MGCRALRISRTRLVNILLLGVAITTVHITWRIYHLSANTKPILGLNESDIRDFHQQWCRMQRWRVDWERMAKPCEGQIAWDQRKVNSEWRTDARRSFITKWEILPAGKITRIKDGLQLFSAASERSWFEGWPGSLFCIVFSVKALCSRTKEYKWLPVNC